MNRLLKHLREFNLTVVCFAVSAIALGRALQINLGFYNEVALWWLTVAFISSAVGIVLHRTASSVSRGSAVVVSALLVAGIAWQFYQLYTTRPGLYLRDDASLAVFRGRDCRASGLHRLWRDEHPAAPPILVSRTAGRELVSSASG